MAVVSAEEIYNNASQADGAAPVLVTSPAVGNLPQELALSMRGLYVLAGVVATQAPQREQKSSDYGACRIELDGRAAVFRLAKTTPTQIGQFVSNKYALLKHGVMSRNGLGGKRGIRVYPPWTKPVAKDAIKTQQWQLIHNRRTDSSN